MNSNSEKKSLVFREVEGLLQVKEPAKKPISKDLGFGFYYPNAVAVSRKRLELIKRDIDQKSDHHCSKQGAYKCKK